VSGGVFMGAGRLIFLPALSHVYGGCIVRDMAYCPFSSRLFLTSE